MRQLHYISILIFLMSILFFAFDIYLYIFYLFYIFIRLYGYNHWENMASKSFSVFSVLVELTAAQTIN